MTFSLNNFPLYSESNPNSCFWPLISHCFSQCHWPLKLSLTQDLPYLCLSVFDINLPALCLLEYAPLNWFIRETIIHPTYPHLHL